MAISAETIIRIFVGALYGVYGLAAWRWLRRDLPSSLQRLAGLFLLTQIVVIAVSLTYQPSSSFEFWLWHLDREWNLPATLASAQLALAGFVALLIAWRGVAQPLWRRLYFCALGLVFLFLAYDEYAVLHEFITFWTHYYFALGVALVAATVAVAGLSARNTWQWHGCLLAGLATSALGGLVVETNCGHRVFHAINLCENNFFIEEPLEFVGMWLALLALLNQLGGVSRSIRVARALYVFPIIWLLALAMSPAIYPIERYAGDGHTSPAEVRFESGALLRGYRLRGRKDSIHLFLSPERWDYSGQNFSGLGYSISLVDQESGEKAVHRDAFAHRRHFLMSPGYRPVYRQWLDIDRPATLPTNRAYWIVLTLWREDGDQYARQKILSSDHPTLGDTQVALGEVAVKPKLDPARPPEIALAIFDNGFVLHAVEAPARVPAGETLALTFFWRSDVDGGEDHAQFVHLGHLESGRWFVYDQQPLGARLPTRLWYPGLADSETWRIPLPADLTPGEYTLSTGLYRSRDRERIPAMDAGGAAFLDARVALGRLVVE